MTFSPSRSLGALLAGLVLATAGGAPTAAMADGRAGFRGFSGPRIGPGFHGGYHGPRGGGYWRGGYGYGYGLGGVALGLGIGALIVSRPWDPVIIERPTYVYADPPLAPPPTPAGTPVPSRAVEPIVYPGKGQSAQQTETDRQDCNRWATSQPSAMADATVFHRATIACLEGRGYTVR